MMNAVGIDVSKGKSTVTIRRPGDEVILPPCDVRHTRSSIDTLINEIKSLEGETKVCMECTGRYYEPMATWLTDAGLFVSTVNPVLIKDFGDDSLRAPKTDKADSKKIARYTLDRWTKLKQYGLMDETRNQLKTMNRQFGFYMDQKTSMKNNLISLLDQTFPGANDFLTALHVLMAARSGWTLSIPTGTSIAWQEGRLMSLRSTTVTGAVVRAITSVQLRLRPSMMFLKT